MSVHNFVTSSRSSLSKLFAVQLSFHYADLTVIFLFQWQHLLKSIRLLFSFYNPDCFSSALGWLITTIPLPEVWYSSAWSVLILLWPRQWFIHEWGLIASVPKLTVCISSPGWEALRFDRWVPSSDCAGPRLKQIVWSSEAEALRKPQPLISALV